MWLFSECRFNFVEISYSGLQTHYSIEMPRRTQFMVLIQENKTFFELSFTLTPWCGGRRTYSYFLPNKLRKYQWGKWKLKNMICFKFLYITDGVLLVLYRRNEWS